MRTLYPNKHNTLLNSFTIPLSPYLILRNFIVLLTASLAPHASAQQGSPETYPHARQYANAPKNVSYLLESIPSLIPRTSN